MPSDAFGGRCLLGERVSRTIDRTGANLLGEAKDHRVAEDRGGAVELDRFDHPALDQKHPADGARGGGEERKPELPVEDPTTRLVPYTRPAR